MINKFEKGKFYKFAYKESKLSRDKLKMRYLWNLNNAMEIMLDEKPRLCTITVAEIKSIAAFQGIGNQYWDWNSNLLKYFYEVSEKDAMKDRKRQLKEAFSGLEKIKMEKSYKIDVTRKKNEDDDYLELTFKMEDKCRELIKSVCIKDKTDLYIDGLTLETPKRYKVKRWAYNAISNYNSYRDLLFAVDFIDNGELTIKCNSLDYAMTTVEYIKKCLKSITEAIISAKEFAMTIEVFVDED